VEGANSSGSPPHPGHSSRSGRRAAASPRIEASSWRSTTSPPSTGGTCGRPTPSRAPSRRSACDIAERRAAARGRPASPCCSSSLSQPADAGDDSTYITRSFLFSKEESSPTESCRTPPDSGPLNTTLDNSSPPAPRRLWLWCALTEKRHRSGRGAFRETRSGRLGRSSRGSRVAHQPEDR
jgi:hypothetical protein